MGTAGTSLERDYSGAPTAELAAVYEKYTDTDLVTFAERIGMNDRDFKNVVVYQKYVFQGLRTVDMIVTGLGLDLHGLVEDGELHIVPSRATVNTARKIAEDEFWTAHEESIHDEHSVRVLERELIKRDDEIVARALELVELRNTLCVKSAEQQERVRRDSERSNERQKRNRVAAPA